MKTYVHLHLFSFVLTSKYVLLGYASIKYDYFRTCALCQSDQNSFWYGNHQSFLHFVQWLMRYHKSDHRIMLDRQYHVRAYMVQVPAQALLQFLKPVWLLVDSFLTSREFLAWHRSHTTALLVPGASNSMSPAETHLRYHIDIFRSGSLAVR